MSYCKLNPRFDVGDLAYYRDAYGGTVFSSDRSKKIAVIVSGPNYGKSVMYADWEVLDEPSYDILVSGRVMKDVPQRMMEIMKKNENSD